MLRPRRPPGGLRTILLALAIVGLDAAWLVLAVPVLAGRNGGVLLPCGLGIGLTVAGLALLVLLAHRPSGRGQ